MSAINEPVLEKNAVQAKGAASMDEHASYVAEKTQNAKPAKETTSMDGSVSQAAEKTQFAQEKGKSPKKVKRDPAKHVA